MEDTGKLEERNKIVSELQTIIKERIELKEIEIPGTITFQVMSVDGGNVPVGAGEVLLLRYSATHLEYSHELEDENQKFHMALHIIYCKEQKGLFGKVKYKTIKHRKEIITEADWKNGKKVVTLMKIKDVEKQVGISKANIRFYEEEGLIHPARNQENNYREYSEADVEQNFRKLKKLQSDRYSVQEIKRNL